MRMDDVSTPHKATFDHSGSSFDSFLEEDGILDEVESAAIKRVIAWQSAEGQKQILRLTTPKLKGVWGPFRSG
jgi:hypothetical protein